MTRICVAREFCWLFIISLVMGIAACDREQADMETGVSVRPAPDAVVARVGVDTITVAYVERAIRTMPRVEQIEYVSPEQVRELVEILIDQKLMAAAASTIGLDVSDKLADDLAAAGDDTFRQEAVLAQAYIDYAVEDSRAINSAAIEEYYKSHPEEFTVPERARITRVVLPSEAAAAPVAALLRQGYTADAIKQQSEASIRAEALWLQRRGDPGPMEEHSFTLQPGDVSEPFPVAAGIALIRVEENRAEYVRPLVEVNAGIAQSLAQEGQREALDVLRVRLRNGVEIFVDEDILSGHAWVE